MWIEGEQEEGRRIGYGLDEQHDDLGLEQHGWPDEDVNDVEVFNDFHTSTKKGLSDVARAAVVSIFICFPWNLLNPLP